MILMSTKQYADYYCKITGLFISPESVAHLCRNGTLDAYKEPEGKSWIIRIKDLAVSPEEYKSLEMENAGLRATIKNIAKLARGD